MILSLNNQTYKIDGENPLDISIPLNFNGAQPNAYGVEKAQSKPCEAGELVGDTRRGGSCNFEQVKFIPHCNGTHTECIGHITNERISVHDCLKDVFIPAALISIEPENAPETNETYAVKLSEKDQLITREAIENALSNLEKNNPKSQIPNPKSLIVRTLPNDESKLVQAYLENIPPFFSTEAMKFIAEIGIKHLLVDMPSNTITELIYVPNEIVDGNYLLNLQIAPFVSDASPSRPILFNILESNQS